MGTNRSSLCVMNIRNIEIELGSMEDKSLYERLGGVYAIAAVVNRFSLRTYLYLSMKVYYFGETEFRY